MRNRYNFELNDLRSLLTIINVICVIGFGVSVCWIVIVVGLVGIVKDLTIDRKINGLLMHTANVLMNVYLLVSMNK